MEQQEPGAKKRDGIIRIVILAVAVVVAVIGIHSYMQSKEEPPVISQTETNRVGDFFTGLYHRPGCPKVEQIRDKNREDFPDNASAKKAGYRECEVCKPGA